MTAWKRKRHACTRIHKGKKTIKILSRDYSMGMKGREFKTQTENRKDGITTFLIKEVLVKQRNHGKHPIPVEWNTYKVHYSLYVKKSDS